MWLIDCSYTLYMSIIYCLSFLVKQFVIFTALRKEVVHESKIDATYSENLDTSKIIRCLNLNISKYYLILLQISKQNVYLRSSISVLPMQWLGHNRIELDRAYTCTTSISAQTVYTCTHHVRVIWLLKATPMTMRTSLDHNSWDWDWASCFF